MADLDDVLALPVAAATFADAAGWVDSESARAGVFANAAPRYYDIWALRRYTWCLCDCRHAIRGRRPAEAFEAAKIREVYSRQIAFPAGLSPIRVRSAFGGPGMYKMEYALGARYHGVDSVGREVAEHVAFNEKIGQIGALPFSCADGPCSAGASLSGVQRCTVVAVEDVSSANVGDASPPWRAIVGP